MAFELLNGWDAFDPLVAPDRRPVERARPLQAGEKAPLFSIANRDDYWTTPVAQTEATAVVRTLPQLLKHGLVVVGFYCPCWGRYASPFLGMLMHLAKVVQEADAQFIVFSNEHPRYLPQAVHKAPVTLVYDVDKTVAQQFGVYSETDPIWDRVSGISAEVYIPALYVVDQTRHIRYGFLDEDFKGFTDHTLLHKALFS